MKFQKKSLVYNDFPRPSYYILVVYNLYTKKNTARDSRDSSLQRVRQKKTACFGGIQGFMVGIQRDSGIHARDSWVHEF